MVKLFPEKYLLALVIGALITLTISIFYLITLQNALKTVSPENRKMRPGNVWLLLIPLFSTVWRFLVVDAIGDAFKKEYEKNGRMVASKPTYALGLTMAVLEVALLVKPFRSIVALPVLICWIIYWVKVGEHTGAIQRLHLAKGEE